MRLLIINFEADELSGVLAWQLKIAKLLAARCEAVVVLTEKRGQVGQLPANLFIEEMAPSIGNMPTRVSRYLAVSLQARRLCRQHRIQACFIHMAHTWAYRLWPVLKGLARIPVLTWYAHGSVSWGLKAAVACSDRMITSTPEGLRIDTSKKRIIGQGVDTELFKPVPRSEQANQCLYVGRISRRKQIDFIVDVAHALYQMDPASPITFGIAGPMLTLDDLAYDRTVQSKVWDLQLQNKIRFLGFVPQSHLPQLYDGTFLHLNLSRTGSLDKTILEALACDCPVLTTNEATRSIFVDSPSNAEFKDFYCSQTTADELARRIIDFHHQPHRFAPGSIRALVAGRHDEQAFVNHVMHQLRELVPQ